MAGGAAKASSGCQLQLNRGISPPSRDFSLRSVFVRFGRRRSRFACGARSKGASRFWELERRRFGFGLTEPTPADSDDYEPRAQACGQNREKGKVTKSLVVVAFFFFLTEGSVKKAWCGFGSAHAIHGWSPPCFFGLLAVSSPIKHVLSRSLLESAGRERKREW